MSTAGCANWETIAIYQGNEYVFAGGSWQMASPRRRGPWYDSLSKCANACSRDTDCVSIEYGYDELGEFCVHWRGCCDQRDAVGGTWRQYVPTGASTCTGLRVEESSTSSSSTGPRGFWDWNQGSRGDGYDEHPRAPQL